MNEQTMYLLLSVINSSGNIKRLVNKGYTYKQLADYIEELEDIGLLDYLEDKLVLTEKGNLEFMRLDEQLKITDKNKWIEPEKKSKLKYQLSKDFIYLPHQDELHF